jgi:hypothetical protein
MNMPTIQTDCNGKLVSVYTNEMTLWFSYNTLIAFRLGAEKVVHENSWSNTTGKHLNQIDGGDKASRVNEATFKAKWKELTGNKPVPQGLLG